MTAAGASYGANGGGRAPAGPQPPVTSAALRRWCLDRPGATEEFPFGEEHSVFKVAGKMFALSALAAEPLKVSLKCEPELAARLRATHPAIVAGYHLSKRHWNTVTIDGSLPGASIADMLEDSYDLVVTGLPRRTQRELGWAPGLDTDR
ncbi:MAG: MmcQ/YjbR family DNA-binding protein [Solirubrobacterales bacterium]|nr:MmcQ/YjbR family DNA-binding protein [Solirubrobacterales bacterium]